MSLSKSNWPSSYKPSSQVSQSSSQNSVVYSKSLIKLQILLSLAFCQLTSLRSGLWIMISLSYPSLSCSPLTVHHYVTSCLTSRLNSSIHHITMAHLVRPTHPHPPTCVQYQPVSTMLVTPYILVCGQAAGMKDGRCWDGVKDDLRRWCQSITRESNKLRWMRVSGWVVACISTKCTIFIK